MCSRPAVSPRTRSILRAVGALDGVEDDRAGSPPSLPRTISAPLRSAHVPSCSAAAARNVSPAAINTDLPERRLLRADLADRRRLADAVDADEQPDVRCRPARPRSEARGRRRRGDRPSRPAARRAVASGSVISFAFTLARSPRSKSSVTRTPTSARSSASSRSSHVSSVIPLRVRMPSNAPASAPRAFAHPAAEVGPLDDFRCRRDGPRVRQPRPAPREPRTSLVEEESEAGVPEASRHRSHGRPDGG